RVEPDRHATVIHRPRRESRGPGRPGPEAPIPWWARELAAIALWTIAEAGPISRRAVAERRSVAGWASGTAGAASAGASIRSSIVGHQRHHSRWAAPAPAFGSEAAPASPAAATTPAAEAAAT